MADKKTVVAKKNKSHRRQSLIEKTSFWKAMALILFTIILFSQVFEISATPKLSFLKKILFNKQPTAQNLVAEPVKVDTASLAQTVLPSQGVTLPITWGNLGKQMIVDGVIDEQKFRALFEGGLTNLDEQMLTGKVDEPIIMNEKNSRFMLDMLWAFGLANKNVILENGEMTDKKYGGDASKFASTGGWSLARGAGFDHYSKHAYVILTAPQQDLVDKVSREIYRPCCGNSTHFPDCNHGMAMLGLLELMAANGIDEAQMYDVALAVNSFWFPQTYLDLATYFKEQGQDWDQVDAKLVLSQNYSSARGYQQTRQQIKSLPKPQQGGGGCGA